MNYIKISSCIFPQPFNFLSHIIPPFPFNQLIWANHSCSLSHYYYIKYYFHHLSLIEGYAQLAHNLSTHIPSIVQDCSLFPSPIFKDLHFISIPSNNNMLNRAASRLFRSYPKGLPTTSSSVLSPTELIANHLSCTNSCGTITYNTEQKRALSAQPNVTAAAADRRLAGRRRFYKNVGIASILPPGSNDKNQSHNAKEKSVESPISAGVDGTQSATGVHTTIKDSSSWSSLLNPHGKTPSGWHTITLDGRAIRTPLGLPLTLPSINLALAVASEWDAQEKFLRPAQMPLMTLCCTAIDQVASDPNLHRTDVMRYLRNDTACYWADPQEDRILHRRQSQAWEGLHNTLSSELLGLPEDLVPAQAIGGELLIIYYIVLVYG